MTLSISTQPTVYHLVPPETRVERNGAGPAYELGALAGKPVMIVLRITEIIEQESLHVSIWGSPDGKDWGSRRYSGIPRSSTRELRLRLSICGNCPASSFFEPIGRSTVGDAVTGPLFEFGVEIQEASTEP